MPSHRRRLILLLFISFLLRLLWALVQPRDSAAIDRLPDQREYLSLGKNLLHQGVLCFFDARFDQTLYAYRTPGYPAIVALCGAKPLAIRVFQALIDVSTILAVYLLARRLSGNDWLSLVAAAFTAFNPFLIYFTGLVLSETIFTALLAWSLLVLIRRQMAIACLLLAALVLVRPSGLWLAPLLIFTATFVNPRPGTAYFWKQSRLGLVRAVLVCGVILTALLPWALRNRRILGQAVWTTTNSGVTLFDGFNPSANGSSDQRFIAEMPLLRSMNELERSQYLAQQARQWAGENPQKLPQLTLAKIARTWSPVPLSNEYRQTSYRLVSAAYALPLDILAVLGLFSPLLSRSAKFFLLTSAVYFTAVHALSVGSLRYRIPVEPQLAILAAAAIVHLSSTFVSRYSSGKSEKSEKR